MLITTQDNLTGYRVVETLGIVCGNTVRARHVGRDMMASLRGVVGGEIKTYTKLLATAREQAMDRMKEDAERKGANAIVCIRFSTAGITQLAAELFVFGTAVRVAKTE